MLTVGNILKCYTIKPGVPNSRACERSPEKDSLVKAPKHTLLIFTPRDGIDVDQLVGLDAE